MPDLNKFDRFNRKVSMGIEWVGLVAFILMMLVTTVDVLGTKLFLLPVFGSLDFMELAQLVAIAFSASAALILGRHVQVEFFALLLPRRVQALVDLLVFLLGFILFAVIVWRLFLYSYDLQIEGEVSVTARIPVYPFGYAAAVAFIPVCLVYLSLFMNTLLKILKKNEP
jgi:TRAP-type C4-dicarboxylate transport system permease small subunit